MPAVPETRYLRVPDGVYIAYQVVGDGPKDVAIGLNFDESNVDLIWGEPDWVPFLEQTAAFARLIIHDRRGLGASSRNVAPPNLETQVSDLLAVLDEVGSSRPILVGGTDGGTMHSLFAATRPDRASGLLWNNPVARTAWAPDYPWGMGPADYQLLTDQSSSWGTAEYGRRIAEWRRAERTGVALDALPESDEDVALQEVYARVNRNTASPDVAREILKIFWETDVRAILPSVHVPAALVSGEADKVEEARYVASLIPNATLHVISGRSGIAVDPIMAILRDMAGVPTPARAIDTVLSTVLFTDIVDATSKQAELGDSGWKKLVLDHHALVRGALARWRGVENDTAGDGFYATFEGPARAIRAALEIVAGVRELGIEVRAGVHTGECEVIDGKCGGISVSIGSRISSKAAASEVLVSQTVKDLVAGSGLEFQDAGRHELKGVPDRWRLYRALGNPP